MARRATGADLLDRAKKDLATAKTADELRMVQAVILPLERGLSLAETAAIIGRSPGWVARERRRYITAAGEPAKKAGRGGRRHQLLTEAEEMDIVKRGYMLSAYGFTDPARVHIRKLLEEKTGRLIEDSTLDSIIRRVAPKFLPDGSAYDMRYLAKNFTEKWLRDRVLAQDMRGRKFAV